MAKRKKAATSTDGSPKVRPFFQRSNWTRGEETMSLHLRETKNGSFKFYAIHVKADGTKARGMVANIATKDAAIEHANTIESKSSDKGWTPKTRGYRSAFTDIP